MMGLASFLISMPAILLLWISLDSNRPCSGASVSSECLYVGVWLVINAG